MHQHKWRLVACCLLGTLMSGAVTRSAEITLLPVSQGVLPNDTSGQVTLDFFKIQQLEGQALKVVFEQAGASFGQSRLKKGDWTGAEQLKVDVLNLTPQAVQITLTIKHQGSRSFGTRIDRMLSIKPGKQTLSVPIKTLKNNDGSMADLSKVRHWYLVSSKKNTTLYFGDFRLVTKGTANPPPTGPPPKAQTLASLARKGMKIPEINKPIMFNTAEADQVMRSLQIYPPSNPWNEDVSNRPIHPNSKAMIATANPTRHLYYNADMNFIIVPPNQPRVPVKIVSYPGESDPGPFPVPDNAPVEGWPIHAKDLTTHQRATGGDRHMILFDPHAGRVHEFFTVRRTDAGWQAGQASTFDLRTNKLRPDGWTSTDAAGLPLLPAVIRYDELQRGMVQHAMRVTIRNTQRAYIYPATHFASRDTNPNLLRMGERLRLRADFDISGFSPHSQAILKGLKKYGMMVADNGVCWCLSVAPDKRIKGLDDLTRVKGRDFEVVVATGPNEGPRAAN